MADPTPRQLLEQARRHMTDASELSAGYRAHAYAREVGSALDNVLQYLEQRHAAASGPAKTPEQLTGDPQSDAHRPQCRRALAARRTGGLGMTTDHMDTMAWTCSKHGDFTTNTCPECDEQQHAACYSDPAVLAIDLDALQRLCDAATPGPWRIDEDGDLRAGGAAPHGLSTLAVLRAPCPVVDNTCGVNEPDPAFIAAARDALPKLIARVRELQPIADAIARAPKCPKCDKPWLGPDPSRGYTYRCADDALGHGCRHVWTFAAEAQHA